MGLGKGRECVSMAQSLARMHMGLQAENRNSEPRAEKMLRGSESSCTVCTDATDTQDLGQSDETVFPHSFSVPSPHRSRP